MPDAHRTGPSIWWWAFGYFAAYAPYSALTKTVSDGKLGAGGHDAAPSGLELLPSSVLASVVTSALFLVATGWWRYAGRRQVAGRAVPMPSRATLLSGLCASGIIATTTLAYTFEGVSIVFVMLLMRGGVLMIAPIVDALHRRRVRWFSWLALALSFASLVVASASGSTAITLACAVDVVLYLACYFLRLSLMSSGAKSSDQHATLRYFVEEQLVSSPALLLGLGIAAIAGADELRAGFTSFWSRDVAWTGPVIGFLSQGTGIFGGLILLDRRENTFCVPVNRASSVLAGVIASYSLMLLGAGRALSVDELVGAGLIVAAILVLSLAPLRERRRQSAMTSTSSTPRRGAA